MDISALLNPVTPEAPPRVPDTRSEDEHRFRRHRFLPLPYHDPNSYQAQLVHPQPVRITPSQPHLVGHSFMNDQLDSLDRGRFSTPPPNLLTARRSPRVYETLAQRLSSRPNTLYQPTVGSPPDVREPWNLGERIPRGMIPIVPHYTLNTPAPEHGRILIPDGENAESIRPHIERSAPLRNSHRHGTRCDDAEHHAAMNRMKEPNPIPFVHEVVLPSSNLRHPGDDHSDPSNDAAVTTAEQRITPNAVDPSIVPTNDTEVILTEFETVEAHTAKCDLCNLRNTAGMSRCADCGWHTCHPCTTARGRFRTHHAASRIHTSPVAAEHLVPPTPKGRRLAKTKNRKAVKAPQASSESRLRTSTRQFHARVAKTSRNFSVTPSRTSRRADDESDTESLLSGAHTLYSLSTQSSGVYDSKETGRGNARDSEN